MSSQKEKRDQIKRSGYCYLSPQGEISYHNGIDMQDHVNFAKLRTCQVFSNIRETTVVFHPEYLTDAELERAELELKRRRNAVDQKERDRLYMQQWRARKRLMKQQKNENIEAMSDVSSVISEGC